MGVIAILISIAIAILFSVIFINAFLEQISAIADNQTVVESYKDAYGKPVKYIF
jgi:hypothetical protein